jgi:hypothetical protein
LVESTNTKGVILEIVLCWLLSSVHRLLIVLFRVWSGGAEGGHGRTGTGKPEAPDGPLNNARGRSANGNDLFPREARRDDPNDDGHYTIHYHSSHHSGLAIHSGRLSGTFA